MSASPRDFRLLASVALAAVVLSACATVAQALGVHHIARDRALALLA